MAKDKKKKKKDKVTYIDDGSTISDMSALGGGRRPLNVNDDGSFKAKWQTYVRAVRSMIVPMLVTMGAICVAFLVLYLILEFAS
ncbi:MAG: hypothetical protein IKC32_00675 [Clostridia bacterium]|nr:hypothetical protein [Clostridia bacterium]